MSDVNKIFLEPRIVHGRQLLYPRCEKSKAIAKLTGHTTIRPKDLEHIKALGFEIEVTGPEHISTIIQRVLNNIPKE